MGRMDEKILFEWYPYGRRRKQTPRKSCMQEVTTGMG